MIDLLKDQIIEKLKDCQDPDLLDFIFKLLVSEC